MATAYTVEERKFPLDVFIHQGLYGLNRDDVIGNSFTLGGFIAMIAVTTFVTFFLALGRYLFLRRVDQSVWDKVGTCMLFFYTLLVFVDGVLLEAYAVTERNAIARFGPKNGVVMDSVWNRANTVV